MADEQSKTWLVYVEDREFPIQVKAERYERDVSLRAGEPYDCGARFYDSDGLVAAFDAAVKPCVVLGTALA